MKKITRCFLATATVFLLSTCSGGGGDSVRVSFDLQKARARGILPNSSDYPCFGLVVTGEGIPSLEQGTGNRLPADRCPYAGAASRFIPLASGTSTTQVEALVPAGRNRLIQVVALEYTTAAACPDGTVSQFIRASNQNLAPSGYGGLFEVGYVIKDLFIDTEITVPNTYNSATAQNLRGCSSIPSALALSPAGSNLEVRSGSTVYFAASGGVPPYSFSKSGTGTIDALGQYVASATPAQTGAITVTDSIGNTATTSLTTFSRAAPVAWYAAESFGNTAGASVTSWTSLGNAGSLSATGTNTLLPSAVNGFPAVRVSTGGSYSVSLSSGTVGEVHAVVVARAALSSSGVFFCIAPSGTCTGSYFKLFGSGASTTLQGVATNGTSNSTAGPTNAGTGFFVAELWGDLNSSASGVQLVTSGGTSSGSLPAAALPLAVSVSSSLLLAGPLAGTIDLAEVVIDYSPSVLGSPTATCRVPEKKVPASMKFPSAVRSLTFYVVAMLLATCSHRSEESIRLNFTIGGLPAGRGVSPVTGFPCFGLLITGNKIRPKEEHSDAGYLPATYCSYAGIGSAFVPLQAGSTKIEMAVPSQSPLLVQVVALDTTGSCPTQSVAQFIADAKKDGAAAGVRGLYEVGSYRITGGLTSSQDITILNSYDSANPLDVLSCASSTSLRMVPSGLVGIDSGGKLPLQVSGGSGSYAYSVSGGGTITTGGLFTAPAGSGQTSYVTVTDTTNSKITATTGIRNFSSTTAPLFWYTANSYAMEPPRTILTTGSPDYWVNQGSKTGVDLHPILGTGGSTHTYLPSELNGYPVLELRNRASLHISGISSDTVTGVHAFVVAKVLATSNGSLFCFSGLGSTCTSADSSTSLQVFAGGPATWRAAATGSATQIFSSATPQLPPTAWRKCTATFRWRAVPISSSNWII